MLYYCWGGFTVYEVLTSFIANKNAIDYFCSQKSNQFLKIPFFVEKEMIWLFKKNYIIYAHCSMHITSLRILAKEKKKKKV